MVSSANYPTIQAALDANPGAPVYVPAGDHVIDEKIRIRGTGSGLWGPGRIVQRRPDRPILEIEDAVDVRIRDITLTRPEDVSETGNEAILAIRCQNLEITGVRVLGNRTAGSAVELRNCIAPQVRNCLVQDYMRIGEDDRTQSSDWGYAFRCLHGSGVVLHACQGALIQGNRIIETRFLPTRELRDQHRLGSFTKKNPQRGAIANSQTWNSEYAENWHQGSALVVTSPEVSDLVRILDNHIENAAQGIDLHADHVVVSQNIVLNAAVGMKAMHGSRHVLIANNQFVRNDLWSIGLMPGAAAHGGRPAADGSSAQPVGANRDGGSIIANNIISEFGFGHAHWIWNGQGTPIRFDNGQQADDPPLREVVVTGNVVYDSGTDAQVVDGTLQSVPPRYQYAVRISAEVRGLVFGANVFHPGIEGVSNVPLRDLRDRDGMR